MPNESNPARNMKREILLAAKRLFMTYGYEKTTFQMMADELDTAKSTILYHYKSKAWILFHIFAGYMSAIYEFVREKLDGDKNNYLFLCIIKIIFYREIMRDECSQVLFYQKDHIAIWANESLEVVERYYRHITNDFHKDFNDAEIHLAAVMSLGAKLSLYKEVKREPGSMDIDDYCYYLCYSVGIFARLDEATIQKNIRRAFEFADVCAFPHVISPEPPLLETAAPEQSRPEK